MPKLPTGGSLLFVGALPPLRLLRGECQRTAERPNEAHAACAARIFSGSAGTAYRPIPLDGDAL